MAILLPMRRSFILTALAVFALLSCSRPASVSLPAAQSAPAPGAQSAPSPAQSAPVPAPTSGSAAASPGSLTAVVAQAGFQTPSSPIAAVDFTLPRLDGSQVSLKSLQGSVVLVNFWATWCPPCKAEIPSLEKLHSLYKSKGLRVLSIDVAEDKDTVSRFVSANKMETTVLLDAGGETARVYGAQSIPLTYIVTKDGSVAGRTLGARDWTSPEVITLVETLLAAK